jgi:hypothetical protein
LRYLLQVRKRHHRSESGVMVGRENVLDFSRGFGRKIQ